MKIPIGRALNYQTPEERLLNVSVSKRTTNAPMIRFRWPINHWTPKAQAAQSRDLLEDDKRAYEQLRIKCGALGKVEDEHMFFRREMELTGRLSPWYTRATYWLYHLVSDYGHSYWRPIAGMVGAMVLLEPILRASFHGPRPAASVHGQGRAFAQRHGPVFCEYFCRLWVLSAVSQ